MANELTGDFDVVAEFSIPAVNRLLAAMHRIERFPHSMSLRVDDDPPAGSKGLRPTIVDALDAFGDPKPDHTTIPPISWPDASSNGDPRHARFDAIVNADLLGAAIEPIVPSRLRGRAQLQVSPPTFALAPGPGNRVTVRLQVMARYFPDPQTPPLAQFVHGELALTTSVSQVASQTGSVVDIDIKASTVGVGFTASWASQPLTAENIAGIEQLIRNALKTSFLPSNVTLPPDVHRMQFTTVPAGAGAVAALLTLGNSPPGNPASVTSVFLGGGDEFGFAVGIDFLRSKFQPIIDEILSAPLAPVPIDAYIAHTSYTVTLTGASIDLQAGRIVLTIDGHAHTPSWLPDFDFRVRQPFTLSPSGATAELVVLDPSIDITTGGVKGWLIGLFTGGLKSQLVPQRDIVLERVKARETVRDMLSADKTFGAVLRSLLKPPGRRAQWLPPSFQLAYNSVEIRPSGIVLHGSLTVAAFPTPHVEFEQIASTSGAVGPIVVPEGPDYSALKTWIPGGTIQRYDWNYQGSPAFHTDVHKFVLLHAGPEATEAAPAVSDGAASSKPVRAFTPLCLTVSGMRLAASGPASQHPVSASVCGYSSFPFLGGLVATDGILPMVALAHPSPRGTVEVAGHTAIGVANGGGRAPNLLVHFADERTGARLDALVQALREAGRNDAATAIMAVLPAEQLPNTRYTDGLIYADAHGGAWERALGVQGRRRPLTLIVRPDGKVLWEHEGLLEGGALAAALRKSLVGGGAARPGLLRSSLRLGEPPPNFLFDYAAGHQLTLRKLAGQPVTLVFWKIASRPSIEAIRALREPVVLAINDGDDADLARRAATEHALAATVVADPYRRIARAYGITVWPTIVSLDDTGVARAIRYGGVEH
jgi:peroxiredoxin